MQNLNQQTQLKIYLHIDNILFHIQIFFWCYWEIFFYLGQGGVNYLKFEL